MKLVLVAGLNPRVAHTGPIVRLFPSRWRIVCEHQKDCRLVLIHNGSPVELKDNEFVSDGGAYHISVIGGTEEYINVFAEVTNGAVPATTS